MAAKGNFAQPFTDYEILERLGSGGMGTVFKARYRGQPENPAVPSLVPGQIVALKVLRPSLGRNQRYRERLRREAELSMRLEHPNLVKGIALGEESGYHYLVMEFCEGPSLRHLLRMWGCFPEDLVIDVGMQIAAALAHAHDHGIVHRDIKPANILVDDDGHAVLTDLGLAKGETDLALTSDGATVGTPQYMSPEQAMNPIDVDPRSDLYSLGATLYHMATGSAPFDGQSVGHVILKILRQRARPAHEVNPELSPGLSLVLRKLLERDIEVRYERAGQLLADLQRLRRGEDPKVDVKALERAEGRQKRQRLRQRVPLVLLAVLVLVLSGVLLTQLGGQKDNGTQDVSDIEELGEYVRRLIREGGRQYRPAFQAVNAYEPDDPSEIEGKERLAFELRSRFEASLTDFLSRFNQEMFEGWFLSDENKTKRESWDTSFLGMFISNQLTSHYGYPPEALPAGQAIFANWQQQRRQRFGEVVKEYGQELVAEYQAAFEQVEIPRIDGYVAQGRFDEASERLAKLAADPGSCQPNPKSRLKSLLASHKPLLERLIADIADERANVLAAAQQAVDDWQSQVRTRLDLARAHAERNEFEKATRRLEAAQKQLDAPPTGLPARVRVPREELAGDLTRTREFLHTTIHNSDLASLQHLEDVTHGLLFALDIDGARDLLANNKLFNEDLAKRHEQLAKDVETFGRTLDWVLESLTKHGRKAKVWQRHTGVSSVQGKLTKVVRAPEPTLELTESGIEQSYRLAELDRADIVDKLRTWDPDGVEQRREGLALFLFFGDSFDAATRLMPRSRPDTEFSERRKRRRRRLADERAGQQQVIDSELKRGEQFLDGGNFEFARRIVDRLLNTYRGSRALENARPRVAALERRLELERLRGELFARLPEHIRRDIDLGLSPLEGGLAELGLGFDFRDPDRFVNRFGPHWVKTRRGIARTSEPDAAKELKDTITLALPVFDEKQDSQLVLDFFIPESGRSLDVLEVSYQGTRVLLYQTPGLADRPGRCLVVKSGRTREAIERDLGAAKRESRDVPEWFFMVGARYQLRLRLGKVDLSNRMLTVELSGQRLISQKVRGRLQPVPETLTVAVAGGIVLERLELTGSPRQ